MARYYVSWITDCSYGAMHVHALFEAPDTQTAKREWKDRVRDQNRCAIAVAYNKKPDYEELWKLPDFLQDKTKEQILDYYAPPERCSFAHDNYCYSSDKCKKFMMTYGCHQQKHDEWEARWKPYLPAQTIELSFVCEDAFGSKLIQWFTHSDFSHVDIIDPDGCRVGARMDGVWTREPDYTIFTRDERIVVPCLNKEAAWDWLSKQIGKPYDKKGLLRSFLFNQGRDLDWRDEGQWWCSELGMAFLEKALGFECVSPASRIAPNDLFIFAGAVRDASQRP